VVFNHQGQLALEDEHELPGVDVVVQRLGGAGRHELFDDVELGGADEIPGVAVGGVGASPLVVLGVGGADDGGGHGL
jgi:hypothetical protein